MEKNQEYLSKVVSFEGIGSGAKLFSEMDGDQVKNLKFIDMCA